MLQGSIVARPRLCIGGWRINIIGMLGQDHHQMYGQRELEEWNFPAVTNQNSLSMQGSRFPSPSMARQLPSQSEMQPTYLTLSKKSINQRSNNHVPTRPSSLLSPNSGHTGRSISRRLLALRCTGMLQSHARISAPAYGPTSIYSHWYCQD